MDTMAWPAPLPIVTERLRLDVLTVKHAAVMVEVLADGTLYEFTGGQAPTLTELRDRYRTQAVGRSPDESQWWLNWVVTLADHGRPVGYVQATVEQSPKGAEAGIAWVIAPDVQGQGLATEAARAMVDWLATVGVERLVAHIHPDHAASQVVARRLGLRATSVIDDGEVCWCFEGDTHAHP